MISLLIKVRFVRAGTRQLNDTNSPRAEIPEIDILETAVSSGVERLWLPNNVCEAICSPLPEFLLVLCSRERPSLIANKYSYNWATVNDRPTKSRYLPH